VLVLADAVAGAAGLLVVIILLLIGVRAVALRRISREQELRPATEAALAGYLAGTGSAPVLGRAAPHLLLRGRRERRLPPARPRLAHRRAVAARAQGRVGAMERKGLSRPDGTTPAGTESPAQFGR
jgi:hypothetical protein